MSEKKTETKTAETKTANTRPAEELVEFTAPLLPGQERQDLVVGVNGRILRIRRGECVTIPACFVKVLEDAARQQVEAHKAANRAQKTEKYCDI